MLSRIILLAIVFPQLFNCGVFWGLPSLAPVFHILVRNHHGVWAQRQQFFQDLFSVSSGTWDQAHRLMLPFKYFIYPLSQLPDLMLNIFYEGVSHQCSESLGDTLSDPLSNQESNSMPGLKNMMLPRTRGSRNYQNYRNGTWGSKAISTTWCYRDYKVLGNGYPNHYTISQPLILKALKC